MEKVKDLTATPNGTTRPTRTEVVAEWKHFVEAVQRRYRWEQRIKWALGLLCLAMATALAVVCLVRL